MRVSEGEGIRPPFTLDALVTVSIGRIDALREFA